MIHTTRRGHVLKAGDRVSVITPVVDFDGVGAVVTELIPYTPGQITPNVRVRRHGRHIVVNAVNVELDR